MKKYTLYILILIALLEIFSFVNLAQAVDSGTCYYKSVQDKVVIKPGWTRQKCIDTVVADNGTLLDWIPDGTPNPVGSCVGATPDTPRTFHFDCLSKGGTWTEEAPNQPVDTCYDTQGYNFGQKTHAQCQPPLIWGTPPSAATATCWVEKADGSYETITITSTDCSQRGGTTQKPAGAGGSIPDNKNYTFLAPLPCQSGDVGCVKDVDGNWKLTTFDPTNAAGENSKLGEYLNIMLRLFIGICAVLAVVMIVVGGIEYMTSELPGNKEAGKGRIRGAIFGLILALGAYTLLFTINPDLLNTELKSLESVTVTVDLMPETENFSSALQSDDGAPPNPTKGCPEGIGRTTDGISVCNRLVSQVNNMIAAARTATPSCILTGGGYRSPDRQIQLRKQNCNGNTTDRNASCTTPTALPGASRHQQGLAIDFGDSGTTIQTTDNKCFKWLRGNAGRYGLSNLPSEPWHWSVDGR